MDTLREAEVFGEPGAVVYLADCLDLMRLMPDGCADAVFADPPYRLSKGAWDLSLGSFEKDHAWNERWIEASKRVLKPGGAMWVSGTHHVIFSLGFALQNLGFRIINSVAWQKPDPRPNEARTTFTHSHETLIWAAKGGGHTFNYDLINAPNPSSQISTVWKIPTVPKREKRHGYHPTQKPLRLVRRAILASTHEGGLVLDPFTGSGTTAVAAKELNRTFVGAEMEREFAELAEKRIRAAERGAVLREISEAYPLT